jgi:hypothetical protein
MGAFSPRHKNLTGFLTMTNDGSRANAADGAEGDDIGSFLANETMAPTAIGDNEPTTEEELYATAVAPILEEEERPPPRLMITKMVSNRADPAEVLL